MPAVALISTAPSFVTPEEHRDLVASTPTSFSSIPPVLRHQEDGIRVVLEPPIDGFTDVDCAKGTLYIVDSVLAFISSTGRGFEVEYPYITLHAISRADTSPSIYCQLDEAPAEDSNTPPGDEEDADMRELKLIPQTSDSLEPIFEALSLCASLHPDPGLESDDDMGEDDAFVDADEDQFEAFNGDPEELSEVGRVRSDFVNDNRFAPY